MAHKKATGSKATQKTRVSGKRLGLKKFGGESVISGNIIVRQRGTVYHPGENVGIGRDHTLFAKKEGTLEFKAMKGRTHVHVR